MFFGGKRPPTIVRTVSVQVKKDKKHTSEASPASAAAAASPSRSASTSASTHSSKPVSKVASQPAISKKKSATAPAKKPSHIKISQLQTPRTSSSPTLKRARDSSIVFDSDSDSDSSNDLATAKRPRQDAVQDINHKRDTWEISSWNMEKERNYSIIHGSELTLDVKKYQTWFLDENQKPVKLRFPNLCARELFSVIVPIDPTDYNPINDLSSTMEKICKFYLPKSQSDLLLDDNNGIIRRFKRASDSRSFTRFADVVAEFNQLVKTALDDGSIQKHLNYSPVVTTELSHHIITQVYSRTVSPQVHLVRNYENGTSNVYGEILPPLASRLFRECNLRSDQVFIDMGSGVGNVVLQAALETGAESWGIEMMPNPAKLALEQQIEFESRCRRFAINPGKTKLIKGNFLEDLDIRKAFERADVILINNKAFLPELNDSILNMMLDLKEGCKVVSLKTFVPVDWKMKSRNLHDPRNLFTVDQKIYPSQGSVSWTDTDGDYFITTKNSSKYSAWLAKNT